MDLVIRNGRIADGTGAEAYCADLCIQNGKIEEITAHFDGQAEREIDVSGLVVSPGFIDIHSHSDACPLVPYLPESKVYQGVTTELCGNCGISILPCSPESQASIEKYCASELELPMLGTRITTHTMQQYAQYIGRNPEATNYAMLIGHGTLRGCVMGFDDREPMPKEMKAMKCRLAEEMEQGAFGMSLGLAYPPSSFSKTEELEELAGVIAERNGMLAVHMRNEGIQIFESVREMLDIAAHTGVHLQISHLKIMHASQWHRAQELLDLLDAARENGIHVTCDQYPYNASANALTSLLPHWAHDGGLEALTGRIKHPSEELLEAVKESLKANGGASNILIASTRGIRPDWEGETVEHIAEMEGLPPLETVLHILNTCGTEVFITVFAQDINVVRKIFCRSDIAVASDAFNLSYDPEITKDKLHPRNFGTFPRALQWSREEKLLPLETVVRKMTGLPAEMMGLKSRGILKKGMAADITIFDPDSIADRTTYTDPLQKPIGIAYVLTSGEVILKNGAMTGTRPGKAILFGMD